MPNQRGVLLRQGDDLHPAVVAAATPVAVAVVGVVVVVVVVGVAAVEEAAEPCDRHLVSAALPSDKEDDPPCVVGLARGHGRNRQLVVDLRRVGAARQRNRDAAVDHHQRNRDRVVAAERVSECARRHYDCDCDCDCTEPRCRPGQ